MRPPLAERSFAQKALRLSAIATQTSMSDWLYSTPAMTVVESETAATQYRRARSPATEICFLTSVG
jgi:hypothetical protein